MSIINGIALAFEGDAVYSMYIRRHLILKGSMTKPNKLTKATKYVTSQGSGSLDCPHVEEQSWRKEEEIYNVVATIVIQS